jgi:hypothetical protein
MVVIKGGGETYSIGNGKYVPSENELPQWFKDNMDMQETNCNGDQRCVELKDKAQKCMEEKGSYDFCAAIVEAYHLCHANALQSRLPQKQQDKMKEVMATMTQQQQHFSHSTTNTEAVGKSGEKK